MATSWSPYRGRTLAFLSPIIVKDLRLKRTSNLHIRKQEDLYIQSVRAADGTDQNNYLSDMPHP